MPNSRYNYICITEDGELMKYAAQSLEQIIEETSYVYKTIICQDLHDDLDDDYQELTWHD